MNDSTFLHIYNRGANRQIVFNDCLDYQRFVDLLERYLGPEIITNRYNYSYPNYSKSIKLHAFCLMPNHFHFGVEEIESGSAFRFMQSLKVAYSKYYNQRYERTGVLFETKYGRRPISGDGDFMHIGRYIHLNPLAFTNHYESYRYSSLRYYIKDKAPVWLSTELMQSYFTGRQDYRDFHYHYQRELAAQSIATMNV